VASYLDGLRPRDLHTLAVITGDDPDQLAEELERRPWTIHDLLADVDVLEGVLGRQAHPARLVSPFLLFAVIVHAAAAELRSAEFVNDWTGPRSRLPVFDVGPLQEFIEAPGRLFFLISLLSSYAAPAPTSVPADPMSLDDMAQWFNQALPADKATLLRRMGDLSLFTSGIFPDRTGPTPIGPRRAEKLGGTVAMTADEVLGLCDRGSVSPGIDALESLGSRWYLGAVDAGSAPQVCGDVASRFRAARRVLNHISDNYLYEIDMGWHLAA
jgi:hypothetical protein